MMASLDAIYTPRHLADELLTFAEGYAGGLVVDPCAGEGALLEAAQRRFGEATQIGAIDIRASVGRYLREKHPDWAVSTADLLNPRAVRSSAVARAARGRTELVLLNPPFSYRGQGGVQIEVAGRAVTASPALAFVLRALAQFEPSSGALCVLPMGSVYGERNAGLWDHLHEKYSVEVLSEAPAKTFPGRRARTVLARVRASATPRPLVGAWPGRDRRSAWDGCSCIDLIRGRVPLHLLQGEYGDGARYVHTTDFDQIERRELFEWKRFAHSRLATEGPLILLARVGKFRTPIRLPFAEVVLSDCVFGLRPLESRAESALFDALCSDDSALESLHVGTGAPYTTVQRMIAKLRDLGWNPRHVPASAPAPDCTCAKGADDMINRAVAAAI